MDIKMLFYSLELKPLADTTDFKRKFIELDKIWAQIRRGAFDS
jgi:hypothetical protein